MSFGETVTRLRGTAGTADYGDDDPTIDWDNPDELDIAGVAVAPRTSSEVGDTRRGVVEGLTLYLPTGTDVEPTDRMRVRGDVYEVIGEVGDWRNPFTGIRPGLEVAVERVEG